MKTRISSIDYTEFFAKALGDASAGSALYESARTASNAAAKLILHQTARLVSLADWMDEVAPKRPALKIFFYVVLAEAVAKMATGFGGKGESRRHVRQFFETFCPPQSRRQLEHSFRRVRGGPHPFMSLSEAIEVLYDIRNDVARRGEYFCFNLLESGDSLTISPFGGETLEVHLSPEQLRHAVVAGAAAAAQTLTDPDVV